MEPTLESFTYIFFFNTDHIFLSSNCAVKNGGTNPHCKKCNEEEGVGDDLQPNGIRTCFTPAACLERSKLGGKQIVTLTLKSGSEKDWADKNLVKGCKVNLDGKEVGQLSEDHKKNGVDKIKIITVFGKYDNELATSEFKIEYPIPDSTIAGEITIAADDIAVNNFGDKLKSIDSTSPEVLVPANDCESIPIGDLKIAVDACLLETPDGSCPTLAQSKATDNLWVFTLIDPNDADNDNDGCGINDDLSKCKTILANAGITVTGGEEGKVSGTLYKKMTGKNQYIIVKAANDDGQNPANEIKFTNDAGVVEFPIILKVVDGDPSKDITITVKDAGAMKPGNIASVKKIQNPHGKIGTWDTFYTSSMEYLFDEATEFNADITTWKTNNVVSSKFLFLIFFFFLILL